MPRSPPNPSRKPSTHRLTAFAFGLRAERVAAIWLWLKGYRILARRYAVPGGEIDLVARRGDVVAFVEVKGRHVLEDALWAITARKRDRLHRAARHWLVRNPWAMQHALRGDALFVGRGRLPRHVENAFPLDIG
jgi:putative endonuclease